MNTKFSIIIPVYNVEGYILECLESVFSQNYPHYEVIIVNDGSKDQSIEIAKEYIEDKPNFVIVHQNNGGLSVARNTGLKNASGEYILYLDSDDLLKSVDALDIIDRNLSEKNADVLFFGSNAFNDADGAKNERFCIKRNNSKASQTGKEYLCNSISTNNYQPMAWSYVYNRKKFNDLNFEPGILHEDNLFTLLLLIHDKCDSVYEIESVVHFYRIRDDSIMGTKKTSKHVNGCLVCAKKMDIYINDKVRNTEKKLLRSIKYLIKSLYVSSVGSFILSKDTRLIERIFFIWKNIPISYMTLRVVIIMLIPNIYVKRKSK
ncbi:glycosyltransferase family 2 protein [Vibrio cyclitrophicus]|uniref:glycosyltransferase family 2 protein n=1 Tax=Vibrio cyclitrophicus TaxID=47951 RepID=UPI0021C4B422|nr:glycosyltransferase [Vibrio cyclitrophicus]